MLNSLSRGFYPAIGATLQGLQSELPEMSYALGNGYEMVAYIFEDPQPLRKLFHMKINLFEDISF